MTPKIGDTVRYLNSTGGGKVVKISGNIAYVDEDGFETPVLLRECVVVAAAGAPTPRAGVFTPVERPAEPSPSPAPAAAAPEPEPAPEPIVETEGGDVLNIVLGFEPTDIKNLSQSSFDAYIVNDSNYWADYMIATRADGDTRWTMRAHGAAEPNMQVFAFSFSHSDLPEMDSMAVFISPYKTDRPFELKEPLLQEFSLDTTRFARRHCFAPGEYFDNPAIALDIVRDDRPARRAPKVDAKQLEKAMREKRRADRPASRPAPKTSERNGIVEVDLHAHELFDDLRGMSNADILNAQIDRFRDVMDRYARRAGTKIVFIHGKGNGVLREAIIKELNHRYKGHDVQDASFREYGFGATQVTIRPNAAARR